ncbi:TPA_asm: hypothetical protein HUJ06_031900 [Nelumbo nucifera]|uniref:Uncharacterized protein n=1 Tax=Nelumbo nucifera TaxID=4432 RepID=A0A822ZWQ0_NELNU|nr:TPA_asm: hypothetical protein HUJ06_031900 [Nelumbo nucifera]
MRSGTRKTRRERNEGKGEEEKKGGEGKEKKWDRGNSPRGVIPNMAKDGRRTTEGE